MKDTLALKRTENAHCVAVPKHYDNSYLLNHKVVPVGPASMAAELVSQWGRTSLMPDPANQGSPSSSWVIMPIEELVTRAFDAAEAFYAEARKRGQVIDLEYPEAPSE